MKADRIQYRGRSLRAAWDEDGCWISMNDVSTLLDYSNPRQLANTLRGHAEERLFHAKDTIGRDVVMVHLSCDTVKALVSRSKLAEKDDLLSWLDEEAQAEGKSWSKQSNGHRMIGRSEGRSDPDQIDLEDYLRYLCGGTAIAMPAEDTGDVILQGQEYAINVAGRGS